MQELEENSLVNQLLPVTEGLEHRVVRAMAQDENATWKH